MLSPATKVSKSYTPFGEQLNGKVSGFGFNAEYYDSATGMINLRARQYEPTMNRFGVKDTLKGDASSPLSLNRYLYVENDPVNLIDPSGMSLASVWNTVKQTASNIVKKATTFVSNAAKTVTKYVGDAVGKYNKSAGQKIINAGTTVATAIQKTGNKVANTIYPAAAASGTKSTASNTKVKTIATTTTACKNVVATAANSSQKQYSQDDFYDKMSDAVINEYNLGDKVEHEIIKGMSSQEKLKYICGLVEKEYDMGSSSNNNTKIFSAGSDYTYSYGKVVHDDYLIDYRGGLELVNLGMKTEGSVVLLQEGNTKGKYWTAGSSISEIKDIGYSTTTNTYSGYIGIGSVKFSGSYSDFSLSLTVEGSSHKNDSQTSSGFFSATIGLNNGASFGHKVITEGVKAEEISAEKLLPGDMLPKDKETFTTIMDTEYSFNANIGAVAVAVVVAIITIKAGDAASSKLFDFAAPAIDALR